MIHLRNLAVLLCLAGCSNLPLVTGQEVSPLIAVERPMSDKPTVTDMRRNARIHVELGAAYVESRQMGVALDEARHAIAYDKGYAPAHVLMGQVYAMLGQEVPARAAFEEALRLAPADPEVNSEYGWFLCAHDRHAEGAARLELSARNPYFKGTARAWANLGLCHVRARNDKAAEPALMNAFALDNQNLRVIYQLAEISRRNGALIRAREFANNLANRLAPGSTPESLWLLLRIERLLGNRVAEQRLAAQLAKEFPASAEYQLYTQGKFE